MGTGDTRRAVLVGMAAASAGPLAGTAAGAAAAHPGHSLAEIAPAEVAGDLENLAILRYHIADESGWPMPARLTFVPRDAKAGTPERRPELFGNTQARPADLAVRTNVVYTLSGYGAITVPPGAYTVYASRGMEYSAAALEVELKHGSDLTWSATLVRQVDTRGWISGDYHLHTLTYSGHGDSNMEERVISLMGEGVEFAVATDHNHSTDYGPVMEDLGIEREMTAVVGNEVSTSVGHFNTFPLDAKARLLPFRVTSAQPLFMLMREEKNEFGIVPVIQVNHPRWGDINYFGHARLDPVTGTTSSDVWSADFDTVEVFNENEGWGYFDPGETSLSVGEQSFSVLRDWFNLLNRGQRVAAVGNSDSHDVSAEIAGVPRNYTPSTTDEPGDIDVREVASALRAGNVFTTTGPFVEFTVNGKPMGSTVTLTPDDDGEVTLAVRVQAAHWVDVDRVKIVVNGDVVREVPVEGAGRVVRLETKVPLPMVSDGWVCVLVEGDTPLDPIVHTQNRPILPLAVTNPVRVDADGDGVWTTPWERAVAAAGSMSTEEFAAWLGEQTPSLSGLGLIARAERAATLGGTSDGVSELVELIASRGLNDPARVVRLSAVRAAEAVGSRELLGPLAAAFDGAGADAHLRISLLRAMIACGDGAAFERIMAYLREQPGESARVRELVAPLVTGRFITEWSLAGPFEVQGGIPAATAEAMGPESPAWAGAWRAVKAEADGRVDIAALLVAEARARGDAGATNTLADDQVVYLRATITSPDERRVVFTLGSDDGCRLWVNDELVVDDPADHGLDVLQHIGELKLRPGANSVLLKVVNGSSDFAAALRIVGDDEVKLDR